MSQVLPSDPARSVRGTASDARLPAWSLPPGHSDGLELQYPARLVTPPAWLGHTPFALWLVGALRPRMLVELGVHAGNSYCAFLQGVQARKLDTRCFGVDHWRGDQHSGLYGAEIYEELRAHHDAHYGKFSTLLRCTFDEALPYFSDGSIDLLHIDGFHTYEAVAHDFKGWLPRMSERGVVLLHDTNVRESGFGIWRLWEEIATRYPTFELTHSHGLGVVYVGREPWPGPLGALFAPKTEADLDGLREYFARLGQSVVDRFSLDELTAKVEAVQARLDTLDTDRRQVRVALERTTAEAAKLSAAHEKAAAQAAALAAERQAYEARLRAATLQAESHTSLLRQRVAITARLQRELLAAHQALRSTSQQLSEASDKQREHEHTLDQIFRSTSWWITAPIRFAGATLRRALGRSA